MKQLALWEPTKAVGQRPGEHNVPLIIVQIAAPHALRTFGALDHATRDRLLCVV